MKQLMLALCTFFSISVSAKTILISKVVDHPALDRTVQGIQDTLKEGGIDETKGDVIRVESAQGNPAISSQIAQKFAGQDPDLVIGVGTLAAQALTRTFKEKNTPILYASVSFPKQAGLTKDKGPITGVSNFAPLKPQITRIKSYIPRLKRLGILYNPGEVNSVEIVSRLEGVCEAGGIQLIKQAVPRPQDLAQGTQRLVPQVDAIFISNDNLALSGLGLIVKLSHKKKVPVFVSDVDAISKGPAAAIGPNQYAVGQQTGAMALKILKGAKAEDLPPETPGDLQHFANAQALEALDLPCPVESGS